MNWMRTKRLSPVSLNDTMGSKFMRHYVDAVRSDGALLRVGVDLLKATTDADVDTAINAELSGCLMNTYMGAPMVGKDAFKGEDGWIEA